MARQSGRLIAFCGVDGVGKSSLVAALGREPELAGALLLKKQGSPNLDALQRSFRRDRGDWHDWNDGSFARAASIGAAMEFLHHNDTQIMPALEQDRLVICDRHAICYAGYLASTGAELSHDDFFHSVRRPDLLFLIEVSADELSRRLEGRGGAGEDENPVLSLRLRAAYHQLLAAYSHRSVVIQNDAPFGATLQKVRTELLSHLAGSSPADHLKMETSYG